MKIKFLEHKTYMGVACDNRPLLYTLYHRYKNRFTRWWERVSARKIDHQLIEVDAMEYDTADYPDFCDAYIVTAYWTDSGKELTEYEVGELNEDSSYIYEQLMDRLY